MRPSLYHDQNRAHPRDLSEYSEVDQNQCLMLRVFVQGHERFLLIGPGVAASIMPEGEAQGRIRLSYLADDTLRWLMASGNDLVVAAEWKI